MRQRCRIYGPGAPLQAFQPAFFCLGASLAHAHGTARAQGFPLCPGPVRLGNPAPFRFFWAGGPARLPVGKKSCTNGGMRSCGIQPKLFDPGGVWQGNHTPAGAGACRPKRPGCFVLAAASFSPVFALLSAGSRPALTQARRLRACPAGLSYAHGCRLGYELRRTPSADSPAVGKGGPLGPGCLLPAAAKPGGIALRRLWSPNPQALADLLERSGKTRPFAPFALCLHDTASGQRRQGGTPFFSPPD